jgi:hypothetical protein
LRVLGVILSAAEDSFLDVRFAAAHQSKKGPSSRCSSG